MSSINYPLENTAISPSEHSVLQILYRWIATTDHKKLGLMYVICMLLFFVASGLMAVAIRMQLAIPNNHFVSPETFNQLFTMHGTTMVFLVGMPMVAGLGNYLVPLMIGARDMAFPRLNAFGFWAFLFGGVLLYSSYAFGAVPDVGWFGYAPLTSKSFNPGPSTDFWVLGVLVAGFGTIASAINVVATTVSMRCPGMTLRRMPMFVWVMLVDALLILIIFPPLAAAQIMLMIDRLLGANFFNPLANGNVLLWQHIFWIFGHPEVYVLIFPIFAILSEVVPVFSRKPIFGKPAMVAAVCVIFFIGIGVWAHHMFTVGLSALSNTFFATATMLVGIPTGIKIFNWTATMYGGKIRYATPMLFACGFLFQFLLAGLTGIMLATAPFDWQLHHTYFVVGHFHFTLIGGLVFGLFAGIYYWFPKATGKMQSELIGRLHFWIFLIGFNVTFLPMHFAGFLGMPRRVYTYLPGHGLEIWNLISTWGVAIQIVGILLFVVNIIWGLWKGEKAGDDPWDAWTLEWATSSPPPEYNFEKIPVVRSGRPLWDLKHPDDPDWRFE
jgi:cytochrome c oxidase subunit 1